MAWPSARRLVALRLGARSRAAWRGVSQPCSPASVESGACRPRVKVVNERFRVRCTSWREGRRMRALPDARQARGEIEPAAASIGWAQTVRALAAIV